MIERCGNCLEYYNKGYQEGKNLEQKWDTILTAYDIKQMVDEKRKLEGHWHVEIRVPYGTHAFFGNRIWVDLINTLTESCGVNLITLKFKLKMNVAGYEFALREG
jgi:hypothetical protein